MGYNLLINGIYWGYNPLIRSPLILTSCPGHPRLLTPLSSFPSNPRCSIDLPILNGSGPEGSGEGLRISLPCHPSTGWCDGWTMPPKFPTVSGGVPKKNPNQVMPNFWGLSWSWVKRITEEICFLKAAHNRHGFFWVNQLESYGKWLGGPQKKPPTHMCSDVFFPKRKPSPPAKLGKLSQTRDTHFFS